MASQAPTSVQVSFTVISGSRISVGRELLDFAELLDVVASLLDEPSLSEFLESLDPSVSLLPDDFVELGFVWS
ncbi:MAG: hypothetical protein KIG97_12665 [Fibrobacter sp.]|uniref:hypothetical protein n=1 Tax=Fibrobacter sp. TaxID=35828 RepID=UPI0025C26000|nr:hypothetical protein [Fibrobacter sp.]MBS7273183.1 hypothetical protein [Fibrobacter sp.]